MQADARTYRIGEVAERTALSRDTLRFYERQGLLGHPPRTAGGFRRYGPKTIERLRFIKRAQAVGLSLGEIRQLVTLDEHGLEQCGRVRNLIATKLVALDQRILELRGFRRSLIDTLRECDATLAGQRDGECPVVSRRM